MAPFDIPLANGDGNVLPNHRCGNMRPRITAYELAAVCFWRWHKIGTESARFCYFTVNPDMVY